MPRRFRPCCSRGLIGEVATLPSGVTLEGAGDCLWDAHRRLVWMGCGFRSGVEAREVVYRAIRRAVRRSPSLPTQPSTTSTPVSVRYRVVP